MPWMAGVRVIRVECDNTMAFDVGAQLVDTPIATLPTTARPTTSTALEADMTQLDQRISQGDETTGVKNVRYGGDGENRWHK